VLLALLAAGRLERKFEAAGLLVAELGHLADTLSVGLQCGAARRSRELSEKSIGQWA
jgi:hypothetical protein